MRALAQFVTLLTCILLTTTLNGQSTGVIVNGQALSAQDLGTIKRIHGLPDQTPIATGRYWYDPIAGLWGREGGPTEGQLLAGLRIGTMRADASGRGTGVFLNGREIHLLEVQYLRGLFGQVLPGRYWMRADGIGGYEGGPPLFNVAAAAQQAQRANQGGLYSGYTRRGLFGSTGSDGECSYYMAPDGSSVMTGKC